MKEGTQNNPIARSGKVLLWLLLGEIAYGIIMGIICCIALLINGPVNDILMSAVVGVFQATFLINAAGTVFSLIVILRFLNRDSVNVINLIPHILNWIYVISLSWVFGVSLIMLAGRGFVD